MDAPSQTEQKPLKTWSEIKQEKARKVLDGLRKEAAMLRDELSQCRTIMKLDNGMTQQRHGLSAYASVLRRRHKKARRAAKRLEKAMGKEVTKDGD